MLHYRCRVLALHIRESVRTALVSKKKAVALRVVAGILRTWKDLHKTPVAVLALSCRNTLAHNTAAGILSNMNHLGAGISLLVVVGNRYRIELAYRVVTLKDGTRIFPCNCRTCLNLRPKKLAVGTFADTAFGNKVVDTSFALLVSRIPVLYG